MGVQLFGDNDARLRELHGYGLSDSKIAAKVGLGRASVRRWRNRVGLPSNQISGGQRIPQKEQAQRTSLYRLGWTDQAIANVCGVRKCVIQAWRQAHGLASKHPPRPVNDGRVIVEPAAEARRMTLYRRGMIDRLIAENTGMSSEAIRSWRVRRGLPANGGQHGWERGPTTFVSLDADLGEGGFNRHALIADDAAAVWLEENGSTVW